MTVTAIDIWVPGEVDPSTHVFIRFEGPGLPAGSDVHVQMLATGIGCSSDNMVWLRPDFPHPPSYPDQYRTLDTPSCGLDVTSVPTAIGERAEASFEGYVYSLDPNTVPGDAWLQVAFSVPW